MYQISTSAEYVCQLYSCYVSKLLFDILRFFIKEYEIGDKRKKVVVTMEEKLRALKRLDSGVTQKLLLRS